MKTIFKEYLKSRDLRNYLLNLNQNQRLSIYRLLYWKNHKEPIPKHEVDLLISDGFFIKSDDGLRWSDLAEKLDKLFKIN